MYKSNKMMVWGRIIIRGRFKLLFFKLILNSSSSNSICKAFSSVYVVYVILFNMKLNETSIKSLFRNMPTTKIRKQNVQLLLVGEPFNVNNFFYNSNNGCCFCMI